MSQRLTHLRTELRICIHSIEPLRDHPYENPKKHLNHLDLIILMQVRTVFFNPIALERPKLYTILAFLSAKGLNEQNSRHYLE